MGDGDDIVTSRIIKESSIRTLEAANLFKAAIDKMQTLLAMQAENDQRKAIGASMAYDEAAFMNI
jgi:hypothetical protein